MVTDFKALFNAGLIGLLYSNYTTLFFAGIISEVFLLVEFTESKTVDVITSAWLVDRDKCCYPGSWSTTKVAHEAKRHSQPGNEWEIYDIRIKKTAGEYFIKAYIVYVF